MLKNYFTVAFRSLARHRGYSLLNVAGLTLGMACCLLLFQYVAYETSFDSFHSQKDRIYRATFEQTKNGEDLGFSAEVGVIFGPTMAAEVPGIARYTRVHPNYGDAVISYKGAAELRAFKEEKALYVDSTFLNMFDFPLVAGNLAQALRQPQTLLMSQTTARKYFGTEEAVGKAVSFTGWVNGLYTVTGVFKDVPSTSHMQFDVLLPMEDLLKDGRFDGSEWRWQNFITYFETTEHADVSAIEANITDLYMKYRNDDFTSSNTQAKAHLQPLLDIHLNKEIQSSAALTGDRKTVYFFTIIGLITLVIALLNYVNLATARAMDRSKEVGVRKVVGARKGQLVGQFLMESAVTNLLALVLAITLALMLLPVVNQVAEVEMTNDLWWDGRFWAIFLSIFGVGALLSGLYPAFVLSSFKPVTVLKGKVGVFATNMPLRKVLVVIQFAASITLLAGTVIVYSQLSYMRGLDTGLDLERVLIVEGPRVRAEGAERGPEMSALKHELRNIPEVQEVALSATTPGRGFWWHSQLYRMNADPSTGKPVSATVIDHDFHKVYGLKVAAGQAFPEGFAVPDNGATSVMVNEATVRVLGFSSNEEAIDERITNVGGPGFVIRGVFQDFQWSSAHREADAVLFLYDRTGGNISMKVTTATLPQAIAAVERTYRRLFPGNPFNYYFADAAFDEQYRADRRFATLFGAFTGIAIIIACLGLFGLASFTTEQRTKEIGVRKVLGATVGSVVWLLSREFMILVGIAFVIAAPAAYFYMKGWLSDFAYHITLGPAVFVLAGVIALFIALVTVSYQAVRVATADPVWSLRYE
jgi:putative ABC transport system permease protein